MVGWRGKSMTRKDASIRASESLRGKAGRWPQTSLLHRMRVKSKHIAGVASGLCYMTAGKDRHQTQGVVKW